MLSRPRLLVPLRWPPSTGNLEGLGVPAASRHPGPCDHIPKGTIQLPYPTVSFGAADGGLPPRPARPSPRGRGSAKAVAAAVVVAAAAEVAAADPSVAPLPGPAVLPAEADRPGGQAAHLAEESPGIWLRRQAP